jgi:hypothetical protein
MLASLRELQGHRIQSLDGGIGSIDAWMSFRSEWVMCSIVANAPAVDIERPSDLPGLYGIQTDGGEIEDIKRILLEPIRELWL